MKMENLSLSALKYFIDTVEMKSLTQAAERNFVSRPAISQSIRRLEDWAGQSFLVHSKRTFKLTEEGQNFYRLAKSAYDHFCLSMNSTVRNDNSLNIGSSASLVDAFILPFIAKHKNTDQMSLKTGTTIQLQNDLEAERINVAVYIESNHLSYQNHKQIHKGQFVMASVDGKIKDKIIITEDRIEVLALKRKLGSSTQSKIITVESWTTALKIAHAMNACCFVPDILLGAQFKKIPNSFKYPYSVLLAHRPKEYLSDLEIEFVNCFK